jgi:hypothetical protein
MYYIMLNEVEHLSLPFPKQNFIPVCVFVGKQVFMHVCRSSIHNIYTDMHRYSEINK